jgi:hypothetical protein
MQEAFRNRCEKAPSPYWIDHWNWNHCSTSCVEYFNDITEMAGLLQVNLESRQDKPRSSSKEFKSWRARTQEK